MLVFLILVRPLFEVVMDRVRFSITINLLLFEIDEFVTSRLISNQ